MTHEELLREQRQALNAAINKRDLETMKSVVHPSYVGKGKLGASMDYPAMMRLVESLPKDFVSAVEVESIEVSGDNAKLVVRRTEGRPGHAITHWRGVVAGIAVGVTGWSAAGQVVAQPQGLWGAVASVATIVAMIWLACFLRPRSGEVRAQETWRTIDGRWLLAEERQL